MICSRCYNEFESNKYKRCDKCRIYDSQRHKKLKGDKELIIEEEIEKKCNRCNKTFKTNKYNTCDKCRMYFKKQYEIKGRKYSKENLDRIIKSKIRNHKCEDILNNRIFNDDDYITIEYIKNMLNDCNEKCCFCKCGVKLINYETKDKEQFSLDRIDSKLAHIKTNIQIACWECNRKKNCSNK